MDYKIVKVTLIFFNGRKLHVTRRSRVLGTQSVKVVEAFNPSSLRVLGVRDVSGVNVPTNKKKEKPLQAH